MSSVTRWFVLGTFASGFMALALPGGVSHADASAPIVLVDQSSGSGTKSSDKKDPLSGGGNIDPSSKMDKQSGQSSGSSSHDKDRHTRSGKTGKSDAESSGKMESKDPLSGGGNTDPSSKMQEQSGGYR